MKITVANCAFVISFLSLWLTSCASAPTQQQIASANYGAAMAPEQCKSIAEESIANQLRDPGSAQFRNEQLCHQGWVSSVPLLGMKAAFGYVQRGEVNGKNAFGGYVGFRPFLVLIRDGVVVRSCITDSDGLCIPNGN